MSLEKSSSDDGRAAAQGRLTARPVKSGRAPSPAPGTHALGLANPRDGLVYVPPGYAADGPAPLLIMLHGAGGTAAQALAAVHDAAERHSVIVLAPDSRDRRTWDVIRGSYGPDIAFLDQALQSLFGRIAARPDQIAIGGFSDGGSYALSLGLTNGAFFSAVLAFSPGFAAPTMTPDHPRLFISHGSGDEVLPVDRCGRRLARDLAHAGYDVDYREFSGGHVMPPELVEAAFGCFLGQ